MKNFIFCQILATLFLNITFADSLKVNSKGRYVSFPGITVIALPQAKDFEVLKSLYSELIQVPIIKKYYAPLPADSYHMTTMNLFTQAKVGSELWKSYIDDRLPWLQSLNRQISASPIFAQGRILGPKFGATIALEIKLSLKDRTTIMELAESLGLSKKVPPYFHVTLGYAYREIPTKDQEKIRIAVAKLVEELIGKNIRFEMPQLTYFNDMTEFVPWNAKTNPFSEISIAY